MTNIRISQDGERYFLSYHPSFIDTDSLGIGTSDTSIIFRSEEARSLYISLQSTIERCNRAIQNLEAELRSLKTVKGANRNLREVRSRNREKTS